MPEFSISLLIFTAALACFVYSLARNRGVLKVASAMAVMASAEIMANSRALQGLVWGVDVMVAMAVLLTATPEARRLMAAPLSKLDIGFVAVVAYETLVSASSIVVYPKESLMKLTCLILIFLVGSRVVGPAAVAEIWPLSRARAYVFIGWISPATMLALITALSGVLGVGEARFDASTPVVLGPFSTARLLHAEMGATGLGHGSALALIIVIFAFFRTRSTMRRSVMLVMGSVLVGIVWWSGTRSAMFATWVAGCAMLLLFSRVGHRRSARRRAAFALVVGTLIPVAFLGPISQLASRSATSNELDLSSLLHSARGVYTDNALRWLGDSKYDHVWGAGLGANMIVNREITGSSTVMRETSFGLIEPFFDVVKFEWGWAGGVLYATYWLGLSYMIIRCDLRSLRRGEAWAGVASCWLLYVWASTVTSFGFSIVNTSVLTIFVMSRTSSGSRVKAVPVMFRLPEGRSAKTMCATSLSHGRRGLVIQ